MSNHIPTYHQPGVHSSINMTRIWVLLALISLVTAEVTTTTETTVGEEADSKEKRAPADETAVHNSGYEGYSEAEYGAQPRTQSHGPPSEQVQQQPSAAQVTYVPLQSLLAQAQGPRYNLVYSSAGQKQQQQPAGGSTFTIQYVPASSIYRSAGNSQKYELVSKTQQAPAKTPGPSTHNSLLYIPPAQGHPYQFLATQPQPQYAHTPQSTGGLVYTLQPVVMTFALPTHNPLLGAAGRGATPLFYYPAASTVPYPLQRQYVFPSAPNSQYLQQQAVASGSPQLATSPSYRIHSQVTPYFQHVKG